MGLLILLSVHDQAKHVLKYSWAESLALGSALVNKCEHIMHDVIQNISVNSLLYSLLKAGIYSQAKGVHLGIPKS